MYMYIYLQMYIILCKNRENKLKDSKDAEHIVRM